MPPRAASGCATTARACARSATPSTSTRAVLEHRAPGGDALALALFLYREAKCAHVAWKAWRKVDCVRSQMRWQSHPRAPRREAPRARPPRRDARRPLRLPPRSPATDDRASARGSTCCSDTPGSCTATAGRASRLPRPHLRPGAPRRSEETPFACLPAQKRMSRTHADEHKHRPEDEDGDGHREVAVPELPSRAHTECPRDAREYETDRHSARRRSVPNKL